MTFPKSVGNVSGMVGVAGMGPETVKWGPETPQGGATAPYGQWDARTGSAGWVQKSTFPKFVGNVSGMVGVAVMGPETA